MPRITLHLDDDIAARLEREAASKGISVADYLVKLLVREMGQDWPEGFFEEIVGGWAGKPLHRPPQGDYETRERL
jgi:hypothetical protein